MIEINKKIVPAIKTSEDYEAYAYHEMFPGKIESILSSTINKYNYVNNKDLFDFLSELLFKIIKAHAFMNGNKRTGIIF